MFSRHLVRLVCTSLLLAVVPTRGDEENLWPAWVRRDDPVSGVTSLEALGPLFFARSGRADQQGMRPLFMTTTVGDVTEGSFLYPFFTWRREADYRTFSFFQLVNSRASTPAGSPAEESFDV